MYGRIKDTNRLTCAFVSAAETAINRQILIDDVFVVEESYVRVAQACSEDFKKDFVWFGLGNRSLFLGWFRQGWFEVIGDHLSGKVLRHCDVLRTESIRSMKGVTDGLTVLAIFQVQYCG